MRYKLFYVYFRQLSDCLQHHKKQQQYLMRDLSLNQEVCSSDKRRGGGGGHISEHLRYTHKGKIFLHTRKLINVKLTPIAHGTDIYGFYLIRQTYTTRGCSADEAAQLFPLAIFCFHQRITFSVTKNNELFVVSIIHY